MAKADAKSKATYRSNFANPAVRTLLEGKACWTSRAWTSRSRPC
jgi:hypothetical protein